MATYSSLPNKLVNAVNGIDYAYRDAGEGPVPLVLLQHFRANLDNWDPALVDALASTRRVVAFDNAGVVGTTPHVIEQMAHDAIAFLTAFELRQADILADDGVAEHLQRLRRGRPRYGRVRGLSGCGGLFGGDGRVGGRRAVAGSVAGVLQAQGPPGHPGRRDRCRR